MIVAYLANQFPSPVEPYVSDEIRELRRRGIHVVAGSVRRPSLATGNGEIEPDIVLQSISLGIFLRALYLSCMRWQRLSDLLWRLLSPRREGALARAKALVHTILGACYAVLLREHKVDHIHVHHGYFGAWVAMVAARLLDVGFSLTLHGSDLLLHGTFLDLKLEECKFCFTVSEFNRQWILQIYPTVPPGKVLVSRLGVDLKKDSRPTKRSVTDPRRLRMLAVGRLHPVKNHAFLVRACAELQTQGVGFECDIAGDGPERRRLARLIRNHRVQELVRLLGHVPREKMDALYQQADLIVLTSRSEGIPLVLMEAMAHGKLVLAPAITGIPELVVDGKTGFLYESGSMRDFIDRLLVIRSLLMAHARPDPDRQPFSGAQPLDWICHAARMQIEQHFNRKSNLETFGDLFLTQLTPELRSLPHANLILQQI